MARPGDRCLVGATSVPIFTFIIPRSCGSALQPSVVAIRGGGGYRFVKRAFIDAAHDGVQLLAVSVDNSQSFPVEARPAGSRMARPRSAILIRIANGYRGNGNVSFPTSGQVHKCTSGQVDKWTSGQVDKSASRLVDLSSSLLVDKSAFRLVDKWTSLGVNKWSLRPLCISRRVCVRAIRRSWWCPSRRFRQAVNL